MLTRNRHRGCGCETRRIAGQVLAAFGDGLAVQLRLNGSQQPLLFQLPGQYPRHDGNGGMF